jgi:ubiquinol-cytochrome c reductase cytochrome b subunit
LRLFLASPLAQIIYKTGIAYPAPVNLSYFWNFGIYATACLGVQIISGIILAMHYTPNIEFAFSSVEHIMRDVNLGWLLRYLHANGASFFFIVVYLHILRNFYYGSYVYPRHMLWIVGVVIFFLMIVTAFLGYVLPWGQMSFWGATVITNLFSAIPYIGNEIVAWLWGGFSVANPTLTRFFSLHFVIPFVILAFVGLHFILLHNTGSNNPLGINFSSEGGITFHPYFITKDLFGTIVLFSILAIILFFFPNILGHPDNYLEANPMLTPSHIVPEWYFLPFYAVLRAIPNKLVGVLALAAVIATLFILPYIHKPEIRTLDFRPLSLIVYASFIVVVLLLGWIGCQPIIYPYYQISQVLTLFYFLIILGIFPFVIWIEKQITKTS